MIDLPESVQSSILSCWCDGQSLLYYFEVLLSNNNNHNNLAFELIRDALVDRYKSLANNEYQDNEEVRDVLDVIREEIRTCKVLQQQQEDSSSQLMMNVGEELRETTIKKVSDWCAIIYYFDTMRQQYSENCGFVLWSGELKSQQGFGILKKAQIISGLWTVTSLDYLYEQFELYNQYLTHPALGLDDELDPMVSPYGYLNIAGEGREANNSEDYDVLQRIQYSLRRGNDNNDGIDDTISPRFFLVPSQMEYEATKIGFAWNQLLLGDDRKDCLVLYWDGDDEGDFEYSLSRLAENVKRILQRIR